MGLDLKEKGILTELFSEHAHNDALREKGKEFEIKRYNYGSKGEAESIGVIPSLNNLEHRNPQKIHEEKKRHERTLHNLHLMREMEEAQARIAKILGQLEELRERIEEGTELILRRDADNARVFLMNEYDMDTDGMSDEEVLAAAGDKVAKDIETQDDLLRELDKLAKKFESSALSTTEQGRVLLPEYLKKFDELKKTAEEHRLSFGEAREIIRIGVEVENELLHNADADYYKEWKNSVEPISSNPFKPPGI